MERCNACPRKCNADRSKETGYCKEKGLKVARVSLHKWEEPPISGDRGSGTVFFSGCNLRCVYCQNYEISRGKGREITSDKLADIFKRIEDEGAHNINLVTPTHFVDSIAKALELYSPSIPVVYNCGGYESVESLEKLKGAIDIYLTDFKYADSALSLAYSKCKDYFNVCSQAVMKMRELQPIDVFEDGLMKKGLIIRHLVLPDCVYDTKNILTWIAENISPNTFISLMSQYVPYGKANEYKNLSRRLLPLEYKIAVAHAEKLGFNNAFIQDMQSASQEYIPDFDESPIEF
ncbi:MAG: radical SAM protein [Clostridia bacterium]|nr:radical SAM protein [Clostridia bacterium]